MFFKCFGVLIVLLAANTGMAQIDTEFSRSLAQSVTWLKLIHLEQANGTSEIISPEFYLSGSKNPQAELLATLDALQSGEGLDSGQHAQCRFPARFAWLKSQPQLQSLPWPVARCVELNKWVNLDVLDSIELIYANGYFHNPASFYGHILLKFNTAENRQNRGLLDKAINYGAILDGGDNPIVYIYKGVFGLYDAGFADNAFYANEYNYGNTELRDLWSYPLKLSREQSQLLVLHVWELKRAKFKYFFFKKNCAYRVSELLELVVDAPLKVDVRPWQLPASVAKGLVANNAVDSEKVAFLPSKRSQLAMRFNGADRQTQQVAKNIARSAEPLNQPEYASLSAEQKARARAILVDYYEWLIQNDIDQQKYRTHKNQILIAQAKERDKPSLLEMKPVGMPPHRAPNASYLQAALTSQKDVHSSRLQIRPAYFDLLDSTRNVMPLAALSMFNTVLEYSDGDVELNHMDFLHIINLNLSQTNMPGDGGMAWTINAGFNQERYENAEFNTLFIEGGIGKAIRVSGHLVTWGMLNGRLVERHEDQAGISLIPSLNALYYRGPFSLGLQYSQRAFFNGSAAVAATRADARWALGENYDLRLGVLHEDGNENTLLIGVGKYW
jgi:hypothetical protein